MADPSARCLTRLRVSSGAAAREVADWLRTRLTGRTVNKDEAARVLSSAASRLDLPFTYGRKLAFYAQRVLLVLVARREARIEKTGGRFVYEVF